MNLKSLYNKTFKDGNVIVCGLRGRGKDMLTANIIDRNYSEYVSNFDYKNSAKYHILDYDKLNCGLNTYKNLISNNINKYVYPYPQGSNCDIFVSDSGVYFPSQFCSQLDREYQFMPLFQALSRQLGKGVNFHCNVQNINRLWTKISEQADHYILCNFCKVFFKKLVIQTITIYDKYESCLNRVEPFEPIKAPILSSADNRALFRVKNLELLRSFRERNGSVKRYTLIYINKSKYNTYYFNDLFKNGGIYE